MDDPATLALSAIDKFLALVFRTHESGGGTYLLLWMLLAVLFTFNVIQFRLFRQRSSADIISYKAQLDEYEEKLTSMNEAFDSLRKLYQKLQKKNAILTGMLVANIGNRRVPVGFWEKVTDPNSEDVPSFIEPEHKNAVQ